MQMAAAPAAAVAASAAARVACDTAATICTSEGPCGLEAWDYRSQATLCQEAPLLQSSSNQGEVASSRVPSPMHYLQLFG